MLIVRQLSGVLILVLASLSRLVEPKVFERCELAKVLRHQHHFDLKEVAQWVCISQHSSGFNTEAQAYSPTGGSHGLFQISDVYWCSPPGQGAGCNLPCQNLRDDDLNDDLSCVKKIYAEHQRLSGDGYTAWNAYQLYCKDDAASYIQDCFSEEQEESLYILPGKVYNSNEGQFSGNAIPSDTLTKTGKIYERCELARELYNKHKMPMEQIPTWVCIVEHESQFNTAAVGRLNTDGSADHGLFQISDLYWCAHDRYSGSGKACGLSCSKLLDSDIADDVHCIKRIHREHTSLSGDGFTAWSVYKPYCLNQQYDQIANCFKNLQQPSHKGEAPSNHLLATTNFIINNNNPFLKNILQQTTAKTDHSITPYNNVLTTPYVSTNKDISHKGKAYTRCSLAQELFTKHNFPIQDIATWVCIAEHESQFNTAAIGRSNTDDSANYGLFQISDRYWCDHSVHGGKACNLACDKLLDKDIKDDITCIKVIHEEHQRLSGDGFTAWSAYKPHCQNKNIEHIKTCFDEKTLTSIASSFTAVTQAKGKIYKKCELAQELYNKHHMPMEQIPKWVCIAQHESSYNTAAVGRLNTDGSADHGLFQVSDLYWCSHDQYGGKACNMPCEKLLDADITDDVECIKTIYEEHTRISGDGFNAWTVYKPHCRDTAMNYINDCFTGKELKQIQTSVVGSSSIPKSTRTFGSKPTQKGKIYKKCELAQELYHQHRMPMEQIPKWVCIAHYESSYNTAAVGRLNTDGSADHGLFQISDLYWCSHDQYGGKACNIPCHKLLDSDISDDVKCIRSIYEEHTRISGDGFNAWTVYQPHCRKKGIEFIKQCFTEKDIEYISNKTPIANNNDLIPSSTTGWNSASKGKIYKKCELAQELYNKHHMPMEQIPKWVCIAQHESSYNTAAVGRLNADGSADHGLFQISDLYWCSHDQYGGKACNIPCEKLLDSDITDDVECIKIIFEEHTRLSGDGFNAWTVYKPHCRNRKMEEIRTCFADKPIKDIQKNTLLKNDNSIQTLQQTAPKISYSQNPFLSGLKSTKIVSAQKPRKSKDFNLNGHKEQQKYANNPFLQNLEITSGSEIHKTTAPQVPNNFSNNKQQRDQQTISSSKVTKQIETKSSYTDNPFLNGKYSSLVGNKAIEVKSTQNSFKNNPFLLSHIALSNAEKTTQTSIEHKSSKDTASSYSKNEISKNYLNSQDFRTTAKPRTAVAKPSIVSTKATKSNFSVTKPEIHSTTTTKMPTISTTTKTYTISTTTKKSTTWKWENKQVATKQPTTTTSWKLQNQKNSTTTTPPQTITTWKWQDGKYHTATTLKPTKTSTTKRGNSKPIKYSTTRKAHNQIQQTTKSWRNKQKSTTLKPLKTTENWRKWDQTTTKKPITTATRNWKNEQKSTNTRPPTTTENWRKWDRTTTKKPLATVTRSWKNEQKSTNTRPPSTTENWRKWDRTTTKKPLETVTRSWKNEQKSTNTRSPTTTENWRNWDRTTTKKPIVTATNGKNATPTKPVTTTENWRKWDQTHHKSSKAPTISKETIQNWRTEDTFGTTENWRKWDKPTITTTKPKTIITKESRKSTQSNSNSLWTTTTIKPILANTVKSATTKQILRESYKFSTTKRPFSNENLNTTTFTSRPSTRNSVSQNHANSTITKSFITL